MSLRVKLFCNTFLFQIGWWGCVLTGRNSPVSAPILITSVILIIHFLVISTKLKPELLTLFLTTVVGCIFETVLISQNVYVLPLGNTLVPVWLICIWILFSTTLNHSLRWMRGRYISSAVLGFVFGPVSYSAGVGFELFEIHEPSWQRLVVIGFGWALLTPFFIFISERISKPELKSPRI